MTPDTNPNLAWAAKGRSSCPVIVPGFRWAEQGCGRLPLSDDWYTRMGGRDGGGWRTCPTCGFAPVTKNGRDRRGAQV